MSFFFVLPSHVLLQSLFHVQGTGDFVVFLALAAHSLVTAPLWTDSKHTFIVDYCTQTGFRVLCVFFLTPSWMDEPTHAFRAFLASIQFVCVPLPPASEYTDRSWLPCVFGPVSW